LCGGNCGGADQEACKPVTDAVKDGFEKLSEASVDRYGEPIIPWHKHIWTDSDDASDWIKRVVGDVQYSTCKECKKLEQTPGIGVYDDIAEGSEIIREELVKLIDRNDIPKSAELKKVSSNDLYVNEIVILALRAEQVQQASFVGRLADDIALLKTVDKLLAARRILMAGKSDPNFNATAKNVEVVDAKIKLLADEISLIKEELELKKVARGDTMSILLTRFESRRRISSGSSYDADVQRRVSEGVKKASGG
jgi:integrating conjugative element protein (TIGR03755 family)